MKDKLSIVLMSFLLNIAVSFSMNENQGNDEILFQPKKLTQLFANRYSKEIYDLKYASNQEINLDFLQNSSIFR